jgi:hypothetical protein
MATRPDSVAPSPPASGRPRLQTTLGGAITKESTSPPSLVLPRLALVATAIGAVAVGAFAVGALAIGRLAIRRGRSRGARLKSLEIEDLTVKRLHAAEITVNGSLNLPASNTGPKIAS